MSEHDISRRRFVVLSVAGMVSGALGQRLAVAERNRLEADDPMAVALAYVEDASELDAASNPAFKPGSDCSNCGQFKNQDADGFGECALFPGKAVSASAWCKAWVKM